MSTVNLLAYQETQLAIYMEMALKEHEPSMLKVIMSMADESRAKIAQLIKQLSQ